MHESASPATCDTRGLGAVAFIGGITNGMIGAWGPVVTPFLMHRGLRPRYAVGSVNTAEIVVAAASSCAVIVSTGGQAFDARIVLAMLAGGVAAAPLAAWTVRRVPARPMGVAVAGLLLLTSVRQLVVWLG